MSSSPKPPLRLVSAIKDVTPNRQARRRSRRHRATHGASWAVRNMLVLVITLTLIVLGAVVGGYWVVVNGG